jgi:DNA polymerase-1
MADLFEDERSYAVFQNLANLAWLEASEQIIVDSREALQHMVDELVLAPFVTFDVETTGLSVTDDKLVAIQFCGRPNRAYFIPIAMMGMDNLNIAEVVVTCAPLWRKGLIGHNISFDWKIMQRWVDFEIVSDTLLSAKLIPELWVDFEHDWSLKNLSAKLFGVGTMTFKDLFPRKTRKEAMRFDTVPEALAVPYACQDVFLTWMLHERLQQLGSTPDTIWQLEHRILKPVARMELLGTGLNVAQVEAARIQAQALMATSLAEIEVYAGKPVNLNATADMAWLLYDHCGLPVLKTTGTGKRSTDKATLDQLAGKHPVVDLILDYRSTSKLEQAFLGALPQMVASDGCIHTSYNQYGAISGRFSSSKPNLQQVPKMRDKAGDEFRKAIRSAFIPPEGFVGLLDIDYSQVEYRLFASLSGTEG